MPQKNICPQCNKAVARRVVKGVCDLCHHTNWRRANPEKVAAREARYAEKRKENRALRAAAGLPTRAWGTVDVVCVACQETKPHYSHGECRPCYRKRIGKIHVCKRCQRVGEHQAKGLCRTCYQDAYARANPEKVAEHKRNQGLRKNYGLSRREHDALLLANPACAICADAFTEELKPAVDHCHISGKVRGILCHRCNKGLGLYRDRTELLRKAAEYLEKNG